MARRGNRCSRGVFLNILIDMNLTPLWVVEFQRAKHFATHWSTVGAPNAPDSKIMEWARTHECIVFTHDLDFGAILAVTNRRGPSVVQIRTANPIPSHCGHLVLSAIEEHGALLQEGALLTIDEDRMRIRILPI